ncbi:MAG: chloride channel protein [Pseudolabrys sp.]
MLSPLGSGSRAQRLLPRLEIPQALRALVRARESGLIVLGALIGALSGLVVAAMSHAVMLLHATLFGVEHGERLSAMRRLDPWIAVTVPTLGGLGFGLALWALLRWRPGREIDPIEANALHGGRMSFRGSLIVALQTVWSSGVGASVGLEAGYTQLASGVASWLGQAFRLRRRDLRVLVGCGAAGAIAGAFGAPLAGAFYAFELVIASYSVANLAAVGVAALVGYLVAGVFEQPAFGLGSLFASDIRSTDLAVAAVVGVAAAGLGIVLMRGVAMCEEFLNWLRIRPVLRPTLGGLIVGAMAIVTPEILSSGHGALRISTMLAGPMSAIILLFVLKSVASIISLGTGFRGGLFFASLLIGSLGGRLFAEAATLLWPTGALDPHVYTIVGMGALSVAVIGGPLTMTFIALETTGDFWLTTTVLIAIIVAAQVTREGFGYSFATWRFHLRGESIRSAADVGWIRELTVRRMMRADVRTVPAHTTVSRFRLVFPLGSIVQVVALDEDKHYAGIVSVAEAHNPELDETIAVRDILHFTCSALLPTMTVKEAVILFDKAEAEALAVVEATDNREVIGLLTESYALRRYADELEQRRQDLLGE